MRIIKNSVFWDVIDISEELLASITTDPGISELWTTLAVYDFFAAHIGPSNC
jgi:hypothetical protein